jgi:asparagine synthase (glutamine-hydrolysing)
MCGIVSICRTNAPVDRRQLKKAADALTHRGPDGEGFWLSDDGRTALAHRRLSIIDLSTGAQPLSNEDGTVHAVINGEFYGFNKIRRNLEQKGHCFKTASDSEILLHLYEQYGDDCVRHLRGEFSFILYDERKRRLLAARDRFGIKPLCYAAAGDTLYLASEAKAIFAAGFQARWDEYAFFHACNIQYVPQDRTLFEGVRQLPPGHLLIQENGAVTISKYWDLDYPREPETDAHDDREWLEIFAQEFETSIRLRLQSDVPVCFHLSGGLDSSAVAALGMKINGTPMDCFTVSFDQEGYDELPIAREMAEKMGAKLHVVRVSQNDLVNTIPNAVWYSEGLAINGHLAGKFLLSRAIRAAGFKVALTGEGSDEILAGYPHLREDAIRHSTGTDAAALAELYRTNEKLAGLFLPYGETLSTSAVDELLKFTPSFLKAKASLGFRVTSLLSHAFVDSIGKHDIYREVVSAFDVPGQLAGRSAVNQSSYLWTKLALANYILRTLGDGCEMAHSVEGRLPFLDHVLFEKIRAMPLRMKIRDRVEKYILREAVRPLLTETVYKRQKHPFIAPPVSRFSNTALDGFIQDTLRSQDFMHMPFFNNKKVLNWLDSLAGQSEKDQVAAEPVLMMILTSFLIHKKFNL